MNWLEKSRNCRVSTRLRSSTWENEIRETEKELAKMMDDLDGSEYDLKGLREFKSLLLGE